MSDRTGTAWLKSITVRNLRNIQSERVELAPFTVVVGQNGSGKSSLVDSFRFLSESVQFTPALATHNLGGRKYLFRLYGATLQNAALGLSVELNRLPDSQVKRALFEFDLDYRDEGTIRHEHLSIQHPTKVGKLRLPASKKYTVNAGQWEPKNAFGISPPESYEPEALQQRLVLPFAAQHPMVHAVYEFLARIQVVRPDPRAIRTGWGRTAETATITGEEVSAVLARLRLRSHPTYSLIMEGFTQAVPYVTDFIKRRTEEGMPRVQEMDSRVGLPLPALSDGTLRALSLVTGLFRDDRPQMVVIDEVEDGLHPGAVEAIIRLIREEAIPAGKQVLLTTHNPYVLDLALAEGPNPAKVVIARRSARGNATFTEAGEALERLVTEFHGRPSDYWLHGGFADFPDMLAEDELPVDANEAPEDEPDAED